MIRFLEHSGIYNGKEEWDAREGMGLGRFVGNLALRRVARPRDKSRGGEYCC